MKRLDFRDLPCPQPVIKTKKALSEGGFSTLEIIVDNEAAKENVLRFLKNSGCKVEEIMQDNEIVTIIAKTSNEKTVNNDSKTEVTPKPVNKGRYYVITSEGIGCGDETLGIKLMNAFFYTLSEYEIAPEELFFINGGVKHCIKGSESLDILNKISDRGTKITACGTCLDFFGVTEKLKIGYIGNLYDLVDIYNTKQDVIHIS